MKLIKIIPTIFYSDIKIGLELFIDCLGFTLVYSEPHPPHPFYIIQRDGVTIHLKEDDEYARKDRPEVRIETDDIAALHQELANKEVRLFHPNLKNVKKQPWGLLEFALLDRSNVCVIVQQRLNK